MLELLPELRDLLHRPAGKLSGGQQQMLAIAQAVLDLPEFLVIDELSLGLAPVVVRRLVPTITQIAESGVGVLLIEQFTTIALSLATTAGVLVRGRLRLLESAERLRSARSWSTRPTSPGLRPSGLRRVPSARIRYSRGLSP